MKNKFTVLFFALMLAVLPFAPAYAQTADCVSLGAQGGSAAIALCRIAYLLNSLIPVLITLGVVYFIYGVITYVIAKDEEAKTRGRNVMIYGLVGLAVIVSIWGLVYFLRTTFAVPDTNTINVPCIESPGIDCP